MQDRFTTNATDDSFHKLMGEIDVLHRAQEDLLLKVSAPLPKIQPRVTDDRFKQPRVEIRPRDERTESVATEMQDRFTTNATDDSFYKLMGDLDDLEDEHEGLFRRVGKMVADLH